MRHSPTSAATMVGTDLPNFGLTHNASNSLDIRDGFDW
jgi:hypothetical protein